MAMYAYTLVSEYTSYRLMDPALCDSVLFSREACDVMEANAPI